MATMGCGHDSANWREGGGLAWWNGFCAHCGRAIIKTDDKGSDVYRMPAGALSFEEEAAQEREYDLQRRSIGRFW